MALAFRLLASPSFAAAGASINDPAAGQKLARELRTMQPPENGEISGSLKISKPNSPERILPLRLKVILVPAGGWQSVYAAQLPNGGTESLIILHATNRPPTYELHRGDAVDSSKETNSTAAFGGSDFTLLDLGLEFLHWPAQILVAREMRKGRGCDVLESRPARTNLYARIVSWLDQETGGLLMAEGYDARGKLLKEFEVKSFKKVAGQWQVREMEIRNRQEKTSTRLQFDFDQQ